MTTFDSAAHPRGHASNPGSFSDKTQGAPEIDAFTSDEPNWGETGIQVGSRTPWGLADNVDHVAPGISIADTPGHGGIKLSPARNRLIPAALRRSSRWYEEDCESNIVGMYFPEAFPRWTQEQSEQSVKQWFPDEYEKATGLKVLPGESRSRDEKLWAEARTDVFISTRIGFEDETTGLRRVSAIRASTGETADFLVPTIEVSDRASRTEQGQDNRIVIDENLHPRASVRPEPVLVPSQLYSGITVPATPGAQNFLRRDLAKRWRRTDGTVETLQQIVDRGVSGKSSSVEDNGKRSYYLKQQTYVGQGSYSVLPVTKATFDAVDAPDDRSAHQIDLQNAQLARFAYDKSYGSDRYRLAVKLREAEAKAAASREKS